MYILCIYIYMDIYLRAIAPMPPTPSIFTSNWLRDAPWVAFERHAWQSHGFSPKCSPKPALRNGETAWPGELKDSVFDLRMCDLQCQTSRPEPKKNRGFCSLGAPFTSTSGRKGFPKTRPPKRGNSMAWRAQGHRFLTCVGVIFNVKRCVQNL